MRVYLMRKKYSQLLLMCFSIIIISSSSGVNAYYNPISRVNISDAFYTDYNGDGLEDDVVAFITVDTWYLYHSYSLLINVVLTLPSGYYFDHVGELFITDRTENFMLVMLDHAIEPGWYHLGINYEMGCKEGYTELIFDPPGGGIKGTTPSLIVINI